MTLLSCLAADVAVLQCTSTFIITSFGLFCCFNPTRYICGQYLSYFFSFSIFTELTSESMSSSAKVKDEEYEQVLQQIHKGQEVRRSLSEEVNPPSHRLHGVISRVAYAAFGVRLRNCSKVIYITRYPPMDGTVIPLLDEPSNEYDLTDENISPEEATEFWSSPDVKQVNGMWKGGAWGLDNLIYHSQWCAGAWVGDSVTIDFVANGVIRFQNGIPGFCKDGSSEVIPDTLNSVWSVNVTVDNSGKSYAAYAMNHLMPQFANDLLFIWKNPKNDKKLVKICKRGNAATVDMQNKLMPGAGEHLEPGEALRFKASLTRAFHEELGVEDVALAQCYVLDLGKFDDPGRDPRYWTFNHKDKTFGVKRYSCTHGFALYFHGDAPALTSATDRVEVAEMGPFEKKWVDMDKLDVTSSVWMLEDHAKIINIAKGGIKEFDKLPDEEKAKYRYNILEEDYSEFFQCTRSDLDAEIL